MVFYFTATGNSLYAVKQLEQTPISIAQAIHDKQMTYEAERNRYPCMPDDGNSDEYAGEKSKSQI